jgi:hypothetical protein
LRINGERATGLRGFGTGWSFARFIAER